MIATAAMWWAIGKDWTHPEEDRGEHPVPVSTWLLTMAVDGWAYHCAAQAVMAL